MTRLDLDTQLRRLAVVYGEPKDLVALAEEWWRLFRGTSAEVFERAVSAYLASDRRYWPRPGEIRALVRETVARRVDGLRGDYLAWLERFGDGEPCPVCAAILACLACGRPPTERCRCGARLGVRHDAERHVEAGIGYPGPRGNHGRLEYGQRNAG